MSPCYQPDGQEKVLMYKFTVTYPGFAKESIVGDRILPITFVPGDGISFDSAIDDNNNNNKNENKIKDRKGARV